MAQTLEKVAELERIPLEDNLPNIEGANSAIRFLGHTSYNYADRAAYDTRFVEEATIMAKINNFIQRGEYFVSMLYTYRSISKAIPQVKSQDQENKVELYENQFAVLEPEIDKLKDFMRFQADAIDMFVGELTQMSAPRKNKELVSENLVWSFVQLLDLLVRLDQLKNMKSCLNNDFAFYRRAFGFLRKNMNGDEKSAQENQEMYLFLANQNRITCGLKEKLHKAGPNPGVPGFDDVLVIWLDQCADMFEEHSYMQPHEKHTLLRVMPFLIYLMDSDDPNDLKMNIFKRKNFKLDRFAIIFKRYPVVPLYGDMHIVSDEFVKRRCKHFDEGVWGRPLSDDRLDQEYKIIRKVDDYRAAHDNYLSQFAAIVNEVKAVIRQGKQVPTGQAKDVYTFILQGFHTLSDWTAAILEQSAWKYSRPSTNLPIDRPPDELMEYEKVVRYNYDNDERFALVEMCAMIKGLAGVMGRADGLLAGVIRRCVHDEVQEFIQVNLRDMIRATTKNKKNVRETLIQLRFMAADWLSGLDPADPALKGKKDPKEGFKIQIPSRSAGPSPTQLSLMRSIVYSLYSDYSPGMQKTGIFSSKDFDTQQVRDLKTFYNRTFFYRYLLDYSGTLKDATDLSMLWYREFYLELSKRMQFPIEMSLPWILTDHVLTTATPNSSMMEYILYPLDLYNDAAERALRVLQQRFMYDEIEAEVNLCFDQLVYKLCDALFDHFKMQASCIRLDKLYKEQLETIVSSGRLNIPKNRFEILLRQRHFQLLGRSIDLNALIGQRMNMYLRVNLDYAIGRFEASDLTTIVELEELIENVKLMHKLLSQYMLLDPFETMMAEANDASSLVSFYGRIVAHVKNEIVNDLIPNYTYNSNTNRFIKPALTFGEDVARENMPKVPAANLFGTKILNTAYANVFDLHKGFIGSFHLACTLRLIGDASMPIIVDDVLRTIDLKLKNHISPYVTSLLEGMPEALKMPLYTYGTAGVYGFFELKLDPILKYAELKTEVFHVFRELGNALIVVNLLENLQKQKSVLTAVHASPFFGITPQVPRVEVPLLRTVMDRFAPAAAAVAKAPSALIDLPLGVSRGLRMYENPSRNQSLFRAFLLRFASLLDPLRNEWMGPPPPNGVFATDVSFEFYRLWSALHFAFCVKGSNPTNQDLFGDGFGWGGAAIMYFLNQHRRFETLDFAYHVMNVEAAAATKIDGNEVIGEFLKNASAFKELNTHVFSVLHAYAPMEPNNPDDLPLNIPEDDEDKKIILSAAPAGQ